MIMQVFLCDIISVADPDSFHYGQPDPDPFHEMDLETDPDSKKLAKIMDNFHKNQQQ